MANDIDRLAQMGGIPAPEQPSAPSPTDNREALEAAAAPKTEADKAQEPASEPSENEQISRMYSIKTSSGKERQLTEEQIASTLDRYRDLNFRNMQNKPILSAAEQLMTERGMTPEQIGEAMMAVAKAQERSPEMGQQTQAPNQPGQTENPTANNDQISDDMLKRWEEENSASLPPGYSDMLRQQANMAQQFGQMNQMLPKILQAAQGVTQAAQRTGQAQSANQQQMMNQQLAMNLDRAQQEAGLPDEAANDFMTFITERDHLLEELIDPELATRLARDYAAIRNQPEMEQLRRANQRRQAFTGSMGGVATSTPSEPQAPSTMDSMIDSAMAQRFNQ